MWRSVPRALYVGYAIPVLVLAAWIVAGVVSSDARWLRLSVVQLAITATSTVMIAIGAFQVARVQSGWRVIAARVAGVAAVLGLVPELYGVSVSLVATESEDARLMFIAITVVEYIGSAAAVISAAGLAVTSRRLTVGLVVAAIGFALLQHPPPALYRALHDPDVWVAVLLVVSPLGAAFVVLGAVGDGLRGKRLGLRRIASAVRGSRLAGAVAWLAATGAIICVVVSLANVVASLIAMTLVGIVVAIGVIVAATQIARAHHEAISSLLVNIAFAGACASVIASAYLVIHWGATASHMRLAMMMWVSSEASPLDCMLPAVLVAAAALGGMTVALWRYARHRGATRLARSLAIRLAAFVIVPTIALAIAGDVPVIVGTAIALGYAALAGGFFAVARELERDVDDPTAAVFA